MQIRNAMCALGLTLAFCLSSCGSKGSAPGEDDGDKHDLNDLNTMGAAATGSPVRVTDYGNDPLNPNLEMWVYVPAHVATKPAILVASHGCNGSGPAFFASTEFASLADQYGFIVIYPSSLNGSGGAHCFDVSSTAATTRTGHGDAASVVAMVNYVVAHDNGDATRVFATGFSSGAMFTQVLLAVFPDVFAGGAPFAGVPFGCLSVQTTGQSCASGQVSQTAKEWGDAVRAVYPDFPGPRPRVQLWHGTTDSVLNIKNLGEELKQWSNVLGLSTTSGSMDHLAFPNPYGLVATRTRYGGVGPEGPLETISVALADHSLPMADMAALAIHFFGLDANADLVPAAVPDTQAPSVPANVRASNVTATGLTLTWSASTDDMGVASYLVSRKAVSDASPAAPVASLSGTTTSTSIYGLSASTAYTCWVQAQDKAGNISNVSTTLLVTTADAPGGGGGGGGNTGGGGGGGAAGGGSSGGCAHGDATSGLALLALGVLALVRGRRGSRRRSPISA